MLTIRRADQRGGGDHGWLVTRHAFSFGDYYDPQQRGFRVLRVINEDRVAPGQGFGMHPHSDMEIVTYVLEGQLQHRDSLGHGAVLGAGEVQRITAGAGLMHSEFNPSPTMPVHFYQIWLLPNRRGHEPGYAQAAFAASQRQGRWQTIVSSDGRDGSLVIQQDARIDLCDLPAGESATCMFSPQRYGWLQVLRGEVSVGVNTLMTGDGLAIAEETRLALQAKDVSELMLFDLP